jgi:hypothetical protein
VAVIGRAAGFSTAALAQEADIPTGVACATLSQQIGLKTGPLSG